MSTMLKRIALTVFLIALLPLAACAAVDIAGDAPAVESATANNAQWDDLLANWIENPGDPACDAPGGVLLVDTAGSRYLEAAGLSSMDDQRPMEVDDRFEIGSNTKSFTVALALLLQEEGVLSMDDLLSKWLPEEGAQIPNGDEVTLRQLAGNTSGIWDFAISMDLPSYPLPEPGYTGKRVRDFSAFEDALAALDVDRITELDDLLADATVLDIQALMDNGQLTAEGLVTYYVERIQRYDVDKLNSVLEINPNALELARQLDIERESGAVRGPMHGIPVLLKDNIATGDGMYAAAGAWAMRDWQPSRDAFLVAQLREAGAIFLGKANLSEWANYMDLSMPNGFSVLGGQTRNPYGPFDTLGSSSGSAVAAAANLAAVTVGTETQGSIIQPASINGVVGLKTSRGLVSRDHILPLVDWMDVPGPMGRTVTDVAVLLGAMTGVDENNATIMDAASVAGTGYTQFLDIARVPGMKLGIVVQDDVTIDQWIVDIEMDEDDAANFRAVMLQSNDAVREQAQPFADIGIELVEIPASAMPATPDLRAVIDYGFRTALDAFLANLGDEAPVASLAEITAINDEDLTNRAPYGQGHLETAVRGKLTADEYSAQVADSMSVADGLGAVFDEYVIDALLSDAQVYAAAGFPALTVPAGYDESGQPVGATLIGDFLGEGKLIAIGYAYEQAIQARQAPDLEQTIAEVESHLNP